jgi:hypothetical protein
MQTGADRHVWRVLFIAFLFLHAAIVAAQASGVPDSWLLGQRKALGIALTLAAGACFLVAGAGLLAQTEWWRAVAVTGAALSLAFFVVFFQPLILIGMALDVAVIVALVWLKWPTKSMVGA